MRADVNLSVREAGIEKLGTRTEMKNLNSFKAIARAISNERQRQIDIIEAGGRVIQETRRWDDTKEESFSMRSKEDAQDYRYFPDPDLPGIFISREWIDEIKASEPEFKDEKKRRYVSQYGIPEEDADIITDSKHMADIFEETARLCGQPKKAANWLMVDTIRILKELSKDPEDITFAPENLAKLIKLTEAGTINSSVAKEVFEKVFADNIDPEKYVKENGLAQENDESALREAVQKVIDDNPKSVADYRGGKEKAIGFLVGQTMKAMQGKANPGIVTGLLKELL